MDGHASRIAGWVWPVCFVAIGAALLLYRDA
jgi:putative copper resistance protein D